MGSLRVVPHVAAIAEAVASKAADKSSSFFICLKCLFIDGVSKFEILCNLDSTNIQKSYFDTARSKWIMRIDMGYQENLSGKY